MKPLIISLIIILLIIMLVALILGFENISVVRYDTYFQPILEKEFLSNDIHFILSRLNENSINVPVSVSYDISQTLYYFEGYGVVVPNNLTLYEYFSTNSELIARLVPLSDSNVYVNSHKRYDDDIPAEVLYSDYHFITDFTVKITRSEGGFYNVIPYSSSGDFKFAVPLDVMNIIQPFNAAVILNAYDKPILDNSEGGLNGIFKTLDYVFVEYPIYLYNYVDRYLTFI